jgi:hypothetical protein
MFAHESTQTRQRRGRRQDTGRVREHLAGTWFMTLVDARAIQQPTPAA